MGEGLIEKDGRSIKFSLHRTAKGLLIRVTADEAFEDLFREASGGQAQSVNAWGRWWTSLDPNDQIACYSLAGGFPETGEFPGGTYTVGAPGHPLIMDGNVINLSWLRLRGLSSPEGVAFFVRGVFSTNLVREELPQKIKSAIKQLYIDFLRPVDMSISISIKENR